MATLTFPRGWIQKNGNLIPRVRVLFLMGLFSAMGTYLYLHGQPLICECGYVKVWENNIMSSGNSQHLADWYSLSHFITGMLIGLIWKLFFPKTPLRYAFLGSALFAVTWEVIEHTEFVLSRYREGTISLGYYGDSVLNSMSDGTMQALGFLTATLVRVKHVIAIFIVLELLALSFVRDSLTVSTIMLVHPIPAIKEWQMKR